MIKTTLKTRLISLLILSSLFLISAFTAIQLNNQVQKAQEMNIYQARQEAFMARERLEKIFANYDSNIPRSTYASEMKDVLALALESGTVESVSILDREGRPVMLEGNLSLVFEDDPAFIEKLPGFEDNTKWLTPVMDKGHKLVNMYIFFKNPFNYILKFTFTLTNVQRSLNAVYGPVVFTVMIVILGNIILGALLSWAMISPIKVLNTATKDVAAGNLDLKIHITTKDELEELSDTFNYMTVELKKMKEKAENANPLTKLPGNIVIREEVEKRMKEGKKFVLIYCDLDNFKAFNDKYGVHAGDDAIMLTAGIFKEAVARVGQKNDFIGHEGGDDFLLLTTPENADKLADYIIAEFDKRIKSLYSKEDLERGYIEAKSREGDHIMKYNIMSISLAGVGNVERDIASYAELTNTAAGLKKVAKKKKKSNFTMDKRSEDLGIGFRQEDNTGHNETGPQHPAA